MILERLEARLLDIDTTIQNIKTKGAAEIAALQRQKAALEQIKLRITPELLEALKALQASGLLQDL